MKYFLNWIYEIVKKLTSTQSEAKKTLIFTQSEANKKNTHFHSKLAYLLGEHMFTKKLYVVKN